MVHLELALDCVDVDAQAVFWAGALGYNQTGAAGQYRKLSPAAGNQGPNLVLQEVPEPKTTKIRLHLDLVVDDTDAEVARLVGLGAARVDGELFEEHGHRWIAMTDPEGNEFCVCAC